MYVQNRTVLPDFFGEIPQNSLDRITVLLSIGDADVPMTGCKVIIRAVFIYILVENI